MIEKKIFSERIKLLRKARKLTLKQLGDIIGFTTGTLSDIENGKAFISFDKAIELANYYGVPLDYLVGREVESGRPLPAVTPDEFALVEKLRALPPEKRKAFEALLD